MHQGHAKRVKAWVVDRPDKLVWKEEVQARKNPQIVQRFPTPHTATKIPLETTETVKKALQNGILPDICSPLISTSSNCSCGAGWETSDTDFCMGRIFTASRVVECKVTIRFCVAKACWKLFDDGEHGIFNFSGHTMLTYDVMDDYANCALTSGMTFAAFCVKKSREYRSTYGGKDKFLNRGTFTKAYMAYAMMRE